MDGGTSKRNTNTYTKKDTHTQASPVAPHLRGSRIMALRSVVRYLAALRLTHFLFVQPARAVDAINKAPRHIHARPTHCNRSVGTIACSMSAPKRTNGCTHTDTHTSKATCRSGCLDVDVAVPEDVRQEDLVGVENPPQGRLHRRDLHLHPPHDDDAEIGEMCVIPFVQAVRTTAGMVSGGLYKL